MHSVGRIAAIIAAIADKAVPIPVTIIAMSVAVIIINPDKKNIFIPVVVDHLYSDFANS